MDAPARERSERYWPWGVDRSQQVLRHLIWRAGVPVDLFPVRNPWLAAAPGITEVESALARGLEAAQPGLKGVYPHTVEVAFGGDVDLERVRHFADGVLLAAEHFPDAPVALVEAAPLSGQSLEGVEGTSQVTAQTWSGLGTVQPDMELPPTFVYARSEIRVDSDVYLSADPGKQREIYSGERASERSGLLLGLGASLPTPAGVHEYIHSVDKARAHPEWREADVVPGHPLSLRDEAMAEVGRRVGKPPDQVSRADVVGVWGEYAATDFGEFVPIMVADAIVNGPHADSFSHRVYDRLQVAVSEFAPGPGAKLQDWHGRPHTRDAHGIPELWDKKPVLPPGAPAAAPAQKEEARTAGSTETRSVIAATAGFSPVTNVAAAPKSPGPRGPSPGPVNHPEALRSPVPPQVYKVHEAKQARGLGKTMKLN
ncbi:MAG TPA: hypothetical protein VLH10_06245 [Yinghuangia sp.]|nr:hypothetical protein [Yinghuangia sp.]